LTVKGNQKTLYRQIRSQFQGKRRIPFVARDHEVSHGRNITWILRAKQAPEHIRENWIGTSWIVEVMATGSRDGKPFQATHLFLTSLRTTPEALSNWCLTAGALKDGIGSAIPSSMRMRTGTAAMAQERWPRCERQPSTCCGWPVFSRFEPGWRR
jgi:hypothetical protein